MLALSLINIRWLALRSAMVVADPDVPVTAGLTVKFVVPSHVQPTGWTAADPTLQFAETGAYEVLAAPAPATTRNVPPRLKFPPLVTVNELPRPTSICIRPFDPTVKLGVEAAAPPLM